MIRRLFERLLKGSFENLQVTQAETGRQALELFTEHHHSVIILDVIMPAMHGEDVFTEVAKICKERLWEMPHCIFYTGFMPSTQVTEIARDSRHTILRKPVSRNEIVSIMESFL
ncbi:MAG: response regulator [Kiritimatiellia bacterium]